MKHTITRSWAAELKRQAAQARAECQRRRALVLRHQDLAARLTDPRTLPFAYSSASHWSGFVPPATVVSHIELDEQRTVVYVPNRSPRRDVLLALMEEAERREQAA